MNPPTLKRLRRLWALVVAIAALALFAAASASAAPNYVALGDSYAAGPLIPNPVLPLGCLKSDNNYPHLAAPSIGLHPARRQLQRRHHRAHDRNAERRPRRAQPAAVQLARRRTRRWSR